MLSGFMFVFEEGRCRPGPRPGLQSVIAIVLLNLTFKFGRGTLTGARQGAGHASFEQPRATREPFANRESATIGERMCGSIMWRSVAERELFLAEQAHYARPFIDAVLKTRRAVWA